MMGAWAGAVEPTVVASLGETPGSDVGSEPKVGATTFAKDGQLIVPISDGGVKVETRWSGGEPAGLGIVGRRGDGSGGKERPKGGLRACRGSSGLERGPAPREEKDWVVCNGCRSGWGTAIPSRSKEGSCSLWAVVLNGLGEGGAMGVGGRPVVRSNWAGSRILGDNEG